MEAYVEEQELQRNFLGPVPSCVVEPVCRQAQSSWQQQIMKMASSLPGRGESSCLFFWSHQIT